MKEIDHNLVEELQDKGFRIEFLDDMSGFWFTKKIKTKYFGKVKLVIEEFRGKVILSAQRNGVLEYDNETVDFIYLEYTPKNLKKITKLLKSK